MYLFLTPSKTDGGVNSQQGAPTTCNLTYWEVSQQPYVQTLLTSLGVVKGQNSALKVSVKENEVPREENSSRASIFATKTSYIAN